MQLPQISNRPGPDCELTVRIKVPTLDRFREDYREQISQGSYFIKSSRSKPEGTRLQMIFVIEEGNSAEVWTWGIVREVLSPAEAAQQGKAPGLRLQLMDITSQRRGQIEQLFATDEAVEAIKQRHSSPPTENSDKAGYVQVARSPRQELLERAKMLIGLVENNADYYQLLDLPRDAPRDAIRQAYRERTRRYHPDQFYRKIPDDLHEELDRAFQKVTEAQRILTNESDRATYDMSIGNYSNPAAQRASMSHVRLQRQFRQAYSSIVESRSPQVQALLEDAQREKTAGSYKLAYSKLKLAQALDPLNPAIKTELKKVKALLPDDEPAEEE
ncbi:MAG: hypothetical protein EP343_12225 [Deltaproteobacteria bacterium]|nr:MAG: hypothetical protein EP343_12225 [Deltaproteobacteria bacterium]